MKQFITLLLFVFAFSTQVKAAPMSVVPLVTSTVNVEINKKEGVFFKATKWVKKVAKAMDGKTIAIIAHLTWVGLIIAFILNNDSPSEVGSFFIRQALGLWILALAASVLFVIPIIGWIAGTVLWLGALVLLLISFLNALNGKMKPVPIFGNKFQEWFASIG